LRVASDSPLEQVFPAEIHTLKPHLLSFWDLAIETPSYLAPFAAIGHGDSSGYVKMDSPAHLGEIVNFYMIGLGPVTPPVATGAPSPSDPPAMLTTGIHVTTLKQDLPIVFAGLAPGMTGIYQVSIRLPETLASALQQEPFTQKLTTLFISIREDGAQDEASTVLWLMLP
jgi:uncharacterized protein (TIGR03437 family)